MSTRTCAQTKIFMLAAMVFCTVGTAFAGNGANNPYYAVFTNILPDGRAQGLWLEDTAHPGTAPVQITSLILDGAGIPSAAGVSRSAILHDWTYDPARHEAMNVRPAMVVYGQGGQLYSLNLGNAGKPQHFSNGSYSVLCGLTALDGQPYSSGNSYVEAFVVPNGWVGDCNTGYGVQTWLIPAKASPGTPPAIEAHYWKVLGAFSDPNTGAFVSWIVWTSMQVEADDLRFGGHTPLLTGLSPGIAPTHIAQSGQVAFVLSSGGGVNHTDQVYRITPNGGNAVTTLSYALTSPCRDGAGGVAIDAAGGLMAIAEPTDAGYAVYSLPITGGAAKVIYSDSTGTECGTLEGGAASAVHLVLDESDPSLHNPQRIIGVDESGLDGLTPVVLMTAGPDTNLSVQHTIRGHVWIDVQDFSVSPIRYSERVMDGDGTTLEDYPNTRFNGDNWSGFFQGGDSAVERELVYLFMPTGGLDCNGATLVAVNTANFGMSNINGVPVDACRTQTHGWQHTSLGSLQQPGGNSAISIDPVGGQLYLLTAPQNTGVYTNLSDAPTYPFY